MARGLSSCGSWALEHGLTVVADGLGGSIACGIFPDQGSNLCLLHKQAASLPLSHQESPAIIKKIYIFILFICLCGVLVVVPGPLVFTAACGLSVAVHGI